MQQLSFEQIVVWGLRSKRHSHRFIHKSFYDNFKAHAEDVIWLDDKKNIDFSGFSRRLFFVSGMAAVHFPILRNASYVFHNVELTSSQIDLLHSNRCNYLNLQVFTNDASGIAHWNTPFAILNSEIRCLYQPWGTPFEFEKWQNSIPTNRTKTEYWIGAIWNNALMQGNSEVIAKFREALRANGIDFKRIGGSRIRISGLSDEKAATFIRKSTLGAVIVGDWQRSAAYIPCRLFKNLSSGIPPILNFDLESMFGGSQLFKSDVSELVTAALDESDSSRQQRLEESQFRARLFTYKEGINRILNSLEMTQSH